MKKCPFCSKYLMHQRAVICIHCGRNVVTGEAIPVAAPSKKTPVSRPPKISPETPPPKVSSAAPASEKPPRGTGRKIFFMLTLICVMAAAIFAGAYGFKVYSNYKTPEAGSIAVTVNGVSPVTYTAVPPAMPLTPKESADEVKQIAGSGKVSSETAKNNGNEAAVHAGFRSQKLLDDHFKKHAGEFGNITQSQYLAAAQNLLNSKPGGDILSKTRANGDVILYNKATNEFGVKTVDGTIRTYFKPSDGINYFNRQK